MKIATNTFIEKPIFISGFNKSGTTLLLSLLDYHPELVVIPEEFHYFQNVYFETNKYKAITEKTGFKLLLSRKYFEEGVHGETVLTYLKLIAEIT